MRYLLVLAISLTLSVCAGAQTEQELVDNYAYIELPAGQKIMLRYSMIDDVIAALDEPEEKEYYAVGGEDFWWKDFWAYQYENGNLIFEFHAPSRAIIRIIAETSKLPEYGFPFSLSPDTQSGTLLRKLQSTPGITEPELIQGTIFYCVGAYEDYLLWGVVNFERGKPTWFDTYYELPWDQR